MSYVMNSVARKEWTPKWDRWTLNAERDCPVLVIRPHIRPDTLRGTPYEIALFKPGCTEEEFHAWLGWRVRQLRKTSWATYKDVYMFVDAATDIRGWERSK